jgi:hypothetical protein
MMKSPAVAIVMFVLLAAPSRALDLHVVPAGPPGGDGSDARPFATFAAAQAAVRAAYASAPPVGGVRVRVHGPAWFFDEPLIFSAADSGTADAPIIWEGVGPNPVRLSGGRLLSNWAPVTNLTARSRFPAAARTALRVVDLRANGITNFGQLRGFAPGRQWEIYAQSVGPLELMVNGRPQTLARWPNRGYVRIAAIEDDPLSLVGLEGSKTQAFWYEGDRPATWADPTNAWMHGYFTWDFTELFARIGALDPATRRIDVAPPGVPSGYRLNQPYYYFDIPEELDEPGEYWVDRASGLLYWWPTVNPDTAACLATVLETPVIHFADARHITLRGFAIDGGRFSGIRITGGADCRVEACTLTALGGWGVQVQGGTNHLVRDCDFAELGAGGVELDGGDRRTLTHGGHAVVNCDMQRLGRLKRCYAPGVMMFGCGMRAANNRIHDLPHSAILLRGNDHVIERNEIYNVALESADVGAIYVVGTLAGRGYRLRENFIHHVGQPDYLCMGIYLDDYASGITVEGNRFERVRRAVNIHGGRDNRILGNTFIACDPPICVGVWAGGEPAPANWMTWLNTTLYQDLLDMNWREPPFSIRYPELTNHLAAIQPDGTMGFFYPEDNRAERNVFAGPVPPRLDGLKPPTNALVLIDNSRVLPATDTGAAATIGLLTNANRIALPVRTILRAAFHEASRTTPNPTGADEPMEPPAVQHVPETHTLATSATLASGAPTDLIFHVANESPARVRTAWRFASVPADAASIEPATVTMNLKPGAERLLRLRVHAARADLEAVAIHAFRDDDRTASARLRARVLPVRTIAHVRHAGAVPEALRTAAPLPLADRRGFTQGTLKLVTTRDALHVEFQAAEPDPVSVEPFWEGSNAELYLAATNGAPVRQFILLPPTAGAAPACLVYAGGVPIEGVALADWSVTTTAGTGWTARATIPFAVAGIPPGAQTFACEAALTRVVDGTPWRGALQRAPRAYADSTAFTELRQP